MKHSPLENVDNERFWQRFVTQHWLLALRRISGAGSCRAVPRPSSVPSPGTRAPCCRTPANVHAQCIHRLFVQIQNICTAGAGLKFTRSFFIIFQKYQYIPKILRAHRGGGSVVGSTYVFQGDDVDVFPVAQQNLHLLLWVSLPFLHDLRKTHTTSNTKRQGATKMEMPDLDNKAAAQTPDTTHMTNSP